MKQYLKIKKKGWLDTLQSLIISKPITEEGKKEEGKEKLMSKINKLIGLESEQTLKDIQKDNKLMFSAKPEKIEKMKKKYSKPIDNKYVETVIYFAMSNIQLLIFELLQVDSFYKLNSSLFITKNVDSDVIYTKNTLCLSKYIYLLISIIKERFDRVSLTKIINKLIEERFSKYTSLKTQFNIIALEENKDETQIILFYILNIKLYSGLINKIYNSFKDDTTGNIFNSSIYNKLSRILRLYQPMVTKSSNVVVNYLTPIMYPIQHDLPLFLLHNKLKHEFIQYDLERFNEYASKMVNNICVLTSKMNYLNTHKKYLDLTSLFLNQNHEFSFEIFVKILSHLDELYFNSYDPTIDAYIITAELLKYYNFIINEFIKNKSYYKIDNLSPVYIYDIIVDDPLNENAIDTILYKSYDKYFITDIDKYKCTSFVEDNTYYQFRQLKTLCLFYHFDKIYSSQTKILVDDYYPNLDITKDHPYIDKNKTILVNIRSIYDELSKIQDSSVDTDVIKNINSKLFENCKIYLNNSLTYVSTYIQLKEINDIYDEVIMTSDENIKPTHDVILESMTKLIEPNITKYLNDIDNSYHQMNPNNIYRNIRIEQHFPFPTIDFVKEIITQNK